MSKFLLGLITGVGIVFLLCIIAVVAAVSFRGKTPSVADGSTLILRLEGDVPEKPALDVDVPFSVPFLAQRAPVTVENIWSMLRHAAADPRIKAVVFEPEGVSLGWAKMQEIRADLEQFRKSGKPLIAFLKAPGVREYYMASACPKIYMVPSDELNLKGIGFELLYFKNTLDKLGVQIDVEHAGKYKDFGDMFTRSTMSPETHEVMTSLVDQIYDDLVSAVARGRNKDAGTVRAIIDDGPFLAAQAKSKGLIDDLRYEDQVLSDLKTTLHQSELKRISEHDYAASPDSSDTSGRNGIAFVVGEGDISRGSADSDSAGDGIESSSFDRMLDRVAANDSIKGVIVRINSPGGEVTASDEMWRAMNELKKKKPVVISMSDDAASGGYYMAMTGDPLIAYPATITGSIGVVFGKPNLRGLYEKVGVSKEQIARGRFALIDSDYAPLTPDERQKLRDGIDAEYEDFVTKVATARHKPVDTIKPIAEGRVWLGAQAKANGLVDEIGGLDRAVEMIKKKAKIGADERINLVLYPAKRSVLDMLLRSGPDSGADAIGLHPRALYKTGSDAGIDAILNSAGLGPLRTVWHDASLRIWLRGGMLRLMPFSLEFK